MSIRLRRLSRATAARRTRRLTAFFKGHLQDFEHREIARAASRPLAPDDINQARYSQRGPGEFHGRCAIADRFERADAVDGSQEVDLQAILIASNSIQIGDWIVRTEDRGTKTTGIVVTGAP
jgi:hypothetical protein